MHTEFVGARDAPAVVFLHGIATSGWMWWQQVPAFADRLRLVVDLPGHGRSHDVRWLSLADTAGRVAEVIRTRTATGRADVVGLSLGGHVALSLLEHHPDVVDRAVISGVTTRPWPRRWLLAPQAWLVSSVLRSPRLVGAQAGVMGVPPEVRPAFAENALLVTRETYRRVIDEVSAHRLSDAMAGVRSPTLVLAGGTERDMIKQAVVDLPAVVPGAEGRIVPGVGHGWNVEAPELFNTTVRDWITR